MATVRNTVKLTWNIVYFARFSLTGKFNTLDPGAHAILSTFFNETNICCYITLYIRYYGGHSKKKKNFKAVVHGQIVRRSLRKVLLCKQSVFNPA